MNYLRFLRHWFSAAATIVPNMRGIRSNGTPYRQPKEWLWRWTWRGLVRWLGNDRRYLWHNRQRLP